MTTKSPASASGKPDPSAKHEIRPGQSIELLKELHILTRDGKMNQDSRRKSSSNLCFPKCIRARNRFWQSI